jgi:hypothetical protein
MIATFPGTAHPSAAWAPRARLTRIAKGMDNPPSTAALRLHRLDAKIKVPLQLHRYPQPLGHNRYGASNAYRQHPLPAHTLRKTRSRNETSVSLPPLGETHNVVGPFGGLRTASRCSASYLRSSSSARGVMPPRREIDGGAETCRLLKHQRCGLPRRLPCRARLS